MATRLGTLMLLLALAACASESEQLATIDEGLDGGAPALSAGARFDALERDLLDARSFRLAFSIKAEGLIESDLRGDYRQGPGPERRLEVVGLFGGREVQLSLQVSGPGVLTLGADQMWVSSYEPPALDEALLLGLTRMGLLHNIARLTGRLEPEGARGGFRQEAACLCFEPRAGLDLAFKVFWGGEFVADAELRFDAAGRPRERIQTVHFPEGSMRVVESYEVFAID